MNARGARPHSADVAFNNKADELLGLQVGWYAFNPAVNDWDGPYHTLDGAEVAVIVFKRLHAFLQAHSKPESAP